MMQFTTVTKTSVNAAEFLAGISARKFQSDGSSRSATNLAPVGTNPCGVNQMASPTTTIRKPTLIIVRADTVSGMNRPSTTGNNASGRRIASESGSGTGKIVQAKVITKGSATITIGAKIVILTRSTPSMRFILSQM